MAVTSGSISVAGLAELEKALFELGSPSTALRVGQRALLTAAEPMVDAIKALAPKDEMNLDQAVKAVPSSRGRKQDRATVLIGLDPSVKPTTVAPSRRGKPRVVKDLGVMGYGPMQELGTGKMAANPFFRPGFDATVGTVASKVGQVLGPEIEKSAARLERKRARAAAKR